MKILWGLLLFVLAVALDVVFKEQVVLPDPPVAPPAVLDALDWSLDRHPLPECSRAVEVLQGPNRAGEVLLAVDQDKLPETVWASGRTARQVASLCCPVDSVVLRRAGLPELRIRIVLTSKGETLHHDCP